MPQLVCPYCGSKARLVSSSSLKPERTGLTYLCGRFPDCDARVNCHPGSIKPMGSLADPQLRRWREKAHKKFDQLWKNRSMSRSQAYCWLAQAMNLPESKTHFAEFDEQQCKRAVELISIYQRNSCNIGA
jgi:DNA-directed RNA polymerase subunit RPC12/RpoP